MNCVFISSVAYSHVIPMESLIKFFNKKNINVYIISTKKNESLISQMGAKFIEYPFEFLKKEEVSVLSERGNKFRSIINEGRYTEAYDYFIKKDIEFFYDHSFDNLKLLYNIIKRLKPDFIIRDAIDRYGNVISKMLNIPCIGLITHCLYSKKFFEQDPSHLYKIFMDGLKYKSKELDNYFLDFRNICDNFNKEVHMNSDTFLINTFHQFDPCEEMVLINAIDGLQPKESYAENRKYVLLYPNCNRFSVEKNIKSSLEAFVNLNVQDKNKIIYIATGTMLSLTYDFYVELIDKLLANNLKVIISNSTEYEKLKNHYEYCSDSVYVDKFIPQQYALKNSDLFISIGGQNSILEAIYHRVPLLIMPVTSEQKLNGILIEKIKIGKTTYIERETHETYGHLVWELLTNVKYKENLEVLYQDMITHHNNFNFILEYVKKRKILLNSVYQY